jgi:hypothetical protein
MLILEMITGMIKITRVNPTFSTAGGLSGLLKRINSPPIPQGNKERMFISTIPFMFFCFFLNTFLHYTPDCPEKANYNWSSLQTLLFTKKATVPVAAIFDGRPSLRTFATGCMIPGRIRSQATVFDTKHRNMRSSAHANHIISLYT